MASKLAVLTLRLTKQLHMMQSHKGSASFILLLLSEKSFSASWKYPPVPWLDLEQDRCHHKVDV